MQVKSGHDWFQLGTKGGGGGEGHWRRVMQVESCHDWFQLETKEWAGRFAGGVFQSAAVTKPKF